MRGLVLFGWLLLIAFLLWPVARWMLGQRFTRVGAGRQTRQRALRDQLVKDPVCQTYVLRSLAVTRSAGGNTHYFCSPECADRFVAGR